MVVMYKQGRRARNPYVQRWADRKNGANAEPNQRGQWGDGQLEYLKELCGSRLSYGLIVSRFNERFTQNTKSRSALIGKASRMGWAANKPPSDTCLVKAMVNTRAAINKRALVVKEKRDYNKKIKVSKDLAPVVFKDPAGLRSDDETRLPRLRSQGSNGIMRKTPEQIAKARLGQLPCIVEDNPLTSVEFMRASVCSCKWPTNESVSCMEVCGAPAVIGAYCERHAAVAYVAMPTKKRNRTYHNDKHEYRKRDGKADAQWIADHILDDVVETSGDTPDPIPNMIGMLDE
jgi:hypothetical protein